VGAAVASGVVAAVLVLPIVPVTRLGSTPIPDVYEESAEQVGWPELVATVEEVVGSLAREDRARAVIMTANYGEAGALELLGRDLPPVHSGHNAYWDWGPPPDDRTVVVTVGWSPEQAAQPFDGCRVAATIDNGVGVENQEHDLPVLMCASIRRPWSETWPDYRHLD
jgi:hypothetical protein